MDCDGGTVEGMVWSNGCWAVAATDINGVDADLAYGFGTGF